MRDHSELNSFVALVGAPNCGKTTLYNWLTNSKFKTVNYPGATVDYSLGNLAERFGDSFKVMDTPGTYSLFPKSMDEEVTLKAIYSHPEFGHAEKIVVVVDGTQISRHLLVATQLKEAGFSFVIALTMADILRKNEIQIDVEVLQKEFGCSVILIDGHLGGGLTELVAAIRALPKTENPVQLKEWPANILESKVRHMEAVASSALRGKSKEKAAHIYDQTAKWDRFLLHPVFGIFIFIGIMALIFSSIFWASAPLMDLVDSGFSLLNEKVLELAPGSMWTDFLGNGIVASFGAVLVFVPQIFILFIGIGLLESSGYLARAATLIDKPFSKLGISGRSFVPLLSGFACAVPAMMATRNIPSKRDRWITNFIIPLMACSARLPVYALLLTFLFKGEPAWKPGLALAALYLGALFVGGIAAGIVNKILEKNQKSFFMMELPLYRAPQFKVLLKQTITRTTAYVKNAGPVIFCFAVLIWVGTTFPNYKAEDAEKLQTSYLGTVGHIIEPVFEPMGGDWRVGVGLLSAFAAREVFVSSMAVTFNITDDDEDAQTSSLLETMQTATNRQGQPIFTVASCVGLLIFFMIALQCMSTVGVAVKESGSYKFAIMQLVVFNVVAYILAVAAVQGLRAIGIA